MPPSPCHRGPRRACPIALSLPLLLAAPARAQSVPEPGAAAQGLRLSEVLRYLPLRGRTIDAAFGLVPGVSDTAPLFVPGGDAGPAVLGSTGAENAHLLDGLNAADPRLGLRGGALHSALAHTLTVSTGAYAPALGRSSGGVFDVRTAPSGDALHGSVFFAYLPLQLGGQTLGRSGASLATTQRLASQGDFGFEIGGPIIKERLSFYAALAPILTTVTRERVVRAAAFDPFGSPALGYAAYAGSPCPSYLRDPQLCMGHLLGAFALSEVRRVPYDQTTRVYNGVARIEVRPAADQALTLQWIGAPSTSAGHDGLLREVATSAYQRTDQVHDVQARYEGRFLQGRLALRAAYGLHYERSAIQPEATTSPLVLYRATTGNPYSLFDFEPVPECQRRRETTATGAQVLFNPCRLTGYARGGFGAYGASAALRHMATASLSAALSALGRHDLQVGFDFEQLQGDTTSRFSGPDPDPSVPGDAPGSGPRVYGSNSTGTRLRIESEYVARDASGDFAPVASASASAATRSAALALRERWSPSFAPGLVIDAGLRWDLQALYDGDGTRRVLLADELAPRVGLSYDFTRKGRSLLFVHYGRYYPSLPLSLNERAQAGPARRSSAFASACPAQRINPATDRAVVVPVSIPGAPCTFGGFAYGGGAASPAAPDLEGPFINEVVAGYRHELPLGILVHASYSYRAYGQVLEDVFYDGQAALIANPGAGPASIEGGPGPALLPRGERRTHAVTLSAHRELLGRFAFLASYSYRVTRGNYPGWFSAHSGQLAPGATAHFDTTDLLANRDGPLPTDRPHQVKLFGVYRQPLGKHGSFIGSLVFTAESGRPINVLGAHPYYGAREVFLLAPGAGGRTPMVTQLDASLRYERALPRGLGVALFIDVLNLLDQRAPTNVDDEYTGSLVGPIVNGQLRDLAKLRTTAGALPALNPSYGTPTAYQAPLSLRLGGRFTF